MANRINQRIAELKVYRKRSIRKRWKKKYNFFKNLRKKTKKRRTKSNNKYTYKRQTLLVPEDFSLSTNPEGVLEFAELCRSMKSKKIRNLVIDFSAVTEITHGAMALLLSVIHYLTYFEISVTGNLPNALKARQIFVECGFLDFFKTNIPYTKKSNSTIMVHGEERIAQARTAPQVENAMETVFGVKQRHQKLQGMIIEMMTNAVNHAYTAKNGYKKWYLSIFHLEEENKVKFCFIDNGEGIIKTIYLKFFISLQKVLAPDTVIKKAFDGDYGSRTQLKERGTGLIAIKGCFSQKAIQNLKVITGNLLYDFDSGRVEELKNSFEGTFYFWELNRNCANVGN